MKSILLVTGNTDTMATLSRMLLSRGYGVISTSTAALALSVVRHGAEIDAVIADYVLPGVDAPHFFSSIKKTSSAPLPVIFMNDHVDIQGYLNVLSHGAFDFLFKPVEPGELFRILKMAVKRQAVHHDAPENAVTSPSRLLTGSSGAERQSLVRFQ